MSQEPVVGHATHEIVVQEGNQLTVEADLDGQGRPYLIVKGSPQTEAWVYPGDRLMLRFSNGVRIKGNTDQPTT